MKLIQHHYTCINTIVVSRMFKRYNHKNHNKGRGIYMNMYKKDAEILRVLAHPLRIKLIKELIDRGPCSVNQIARFLSTPQSTTSQNLAKLKSQRIVSSYRKGTEMYYLASNENINSIIEMLLDEELE